MQLTKEQRQHINEQIDIDILLGVIPCPANRNKRIGYYRYLLNKLNLDKNTVIQSIVIQRLKP